MEVRTKRSRKDRNARSRPDTTAELQFVNIVSTGQDEKTRTRAIVRANAAHFHWRHNRPPQDKSRSKQLKHELRSPPKHSKRESFPTQPQPYAATASNVKHTTKNEMSRPQISSDHPKEDDTFCSHIGISPSTSMPLQNNQLGLEVLDPFSTYESEFPAEFVSRCITYNARVVLPAMFPGDAENFNIRAKMLELSISHAPMLQVFIMGALIYSEGAHRITHSSSTALSVFRARAEIVRHVSIAMRDPVEACNDVNIFAVSSLAKNGFFQSVQTSLKTPKQGPLRNLQFLSALGLTENVPIHFNGLWKIIEFKGGLGTVKMPGVAALVSFADLCIATRNITVPRYPVVTLSCPSEEFTFQHRVNSFSTGTGLHEVLSMLNSYTLMIDDFCQGLRPVTESVLIDHRNTVQNALLSLQPKDGSYECCRLASLIYSLLVTFPLPSASAPLWRLVGLLKVALTEWDGGDETLIWILTLGGIGAIGTSERKWFVYKFRCIMTMTGIVSWDEAKVIIKGGLWHEVTNNEDGYDFWLESQSIQELV